MIYLKWIVMLPVSLLVTVLAFPLAPLIVPFVQYREGLLDNATKTGMGWYLIPLFNWFQTPDNSIDGDEGWRVEHWQWRYKFPPKIATYIGRVGWLWRNPGQGFGCVTLTGNPIVATYTGDLNVNDSPLHEGTCTVHCQGLFQWVWVKRISAKKCIYCNFGWNVKGCVNAADTFHLATYTFSPRISTVVE